VVDRPGVLSDLAGVFGRHGISIAKVIQDGQAHGQSVSLVIMTHRAREASVQAAVREIEALEAVTAPTTLIRVEADDE
jgi:homoserine dehydrogenase